MKPQQLDISKFCQAHHIAPEPFITNYKNTYAPLLNSIVERYFSLGKKPMFIGLNGAQGSGKSTLASLMCEILTKQFSLNTVQLSIDDLYKTRLNRQQMAKSTHPLFATRGVPGTHDINLGLSLFNLLADQSCREVLLPRFDKASDEQLPEQQWGKLTALPDIVIFEGWCVGTIAQKESQLATAINSLEAKQDGQMVWRKRVNQELKQSYRQLFSYIDFLIFLKAPDYSCVFQWRQEQEQKLIKKLKQTNKNLSRTMNDEQLKNFMMYFERLTRHNLETMPSYADITIELNEDRTPKLAL
ncbi:hypothetical protein [Aliikangiella coralliicola]|uniref:Kinase n=1 Tax=Aliikangiella coralliicola TaxID=2592383 RepID=A0A545UAI0_9GAMM|nr:hypothetical protein [Aliikangiella coralliicola]TQV86471.1 hypothetical protein FLL46_16275 [Aliikangiella coralliicola]